MTIQRAWDQEWNNANSQRNYPLADDASGADTTGAFRLPPEVLVGIDLPVRADAGVDPGKVYLSHFYASADGFALVVSADLGDGSAVPLATASVPAAGHAPYRAYPLAGVGPFDDSLGAVVVGRLADLARQPAGAWAFDLAGGRLDPDAVRPQLRGVSGLVVVDGGQRSAPLRGVVELVAGANVRLTPEVGPGGAAVRLDFVAASGTVTTETCGCGDDPAVGPPVRSIAGAVPDAAGNVDLVGTDCLRVTAEGNAVRLADTCAAPCCSCPELELVTRELERLRAEAAGVRAFADRLGVSVRTTEAVVLASRLDDCG